MAVIRDPAAARVVESGGPTYLDIDEIEDGQILRREAQKLVGVDTWTVSNPDNTELYMDPAGDDNAAGGVSTPLQTPRELARRIHAVPFGERLKVNWAAGEFRLPDYFTLDPSGPSRFILGTGRSLGQFFGTLTTVVTAPIVSTSGITITCNPAVPFVAGEHRGRFIALSATSYGTIIDNTTTDLIIAVGTTPALPSSGTISILEPATIIKPPVTNPTAIANRFRAWGFMSWLGVRWDGGFISNELFPGQYTYRACQFHNAGQTGLATGSGAFAQVSGCSFKSCLSFGVASTGSGGGGQVNNSYFESCDVGVQTFLGGTITLGANTRIGFRSGSHALLSKSGGFINDETFAVDLQSIGTYCKVQRQAHYQKVNWPLTAARVGGGSPTSYAFNFDGGGNVADLLDSASQNLTPGVSYFNFEAGIGNVSLATYAAGGYAMVDAVGNRIYDGDDA